MLRVNLVFLLLFIGASFGNPAGDRISVKKRASNLPVISGDEDVESLKMLKQKRWPKQEVIVKQIEAFGPDHPYRKQLDHQQPQQQPDKGVAPGVQSFSEQHSSASQYSNINGNVLSRSDQQHKASENGNLMAAYHNAKVEEANMGQMPTHQEFTELDIPNENIHKKILNKNGNTFQFNQANDNAAQYNPANLSPAQFNAANQEPAPLFGAANSVRAHEFAPSNDLESLYNYMPLANENALQFEAANKLQKRTQVEEDKVSTAEELTRYILSTGDEEGVANYFQQLILEGQMDEYEALDYLNLIKSMLSAEKESELELEKEEEREREAQLILDFSDYLDSKFQNGEIPAHLYRGLKGKLMESVIDRAAADPQFLAEPAAALSSRRRRR